MYTISYLTLAIQEIIHREMSQLVSVHKCKMLPNVIKLAGVELSECIRAILDCMQSE